MFLSGNANDLKNILHFPLDVFIMDINLGSINRFGSTFPGASSCQQRVQDFFPQNDKTCHRSQTLWGGLVEPGVLDPPDQVFATKFLQIVGSLTAMIMGNGRSKNLLDSFRKRRCCKSPWMGRKSDYPFHHGSHSRPIDIDASNSGLPHLRGKRPSIQSLIANERHIHSSESSQKPLHDDFERRRDLGKPLNFPAISQLFDVVSNHLDPQHVFAFAIHLDRQLPIMDFEDRQIIDRSLNSDLESGLALDIPPKKATRLGAKDGLDRLEVKRGPRPINGALKDLIQDASTRKEKITAILGLVNGIGITKSTFLLLPTLQSETQARVNPTLTGSNQAPYRARSSHGICDPGQACGVGDLSKAIIFFGKRNLALPCLRCHILVSVKDNLSRKRGMGTEFDHEVSPLRVQDMERIMVDVSDFPLNVGDALLRTVHIENRCRGQSSDDTEDSPESRILGQMRFGRFMLPAPSWAVNQRNPPVSWHKHGFSG
jgi:hypothetical protein